MANKFRYLRGDTRAIRLPAYATDAIEIGDLLWWDAANNAVRHASAISGADYAAKATAFAAAFIGVASQAKAAGATGNIAVWTAGDFQFDAPSGTGTDYDPTTLLAIGDGTDVLDQTVVKTTNVTDAIARVIAPKTTSAAVVEARLLSRTSILY